LVNKVTFKISSAAAPYIGTDKPRQERLKAAAGQVRLPPTDFVLLIYYLCHDPDPEVKRLAVATLRGLDQGFLSQLLSNQELHPGILDALVQLHFKKPELFALLAAHPMLSEKSAIFLAEQALLNGAPGDEPGSAGMEPAPEEGPEEAPGASLEETLGEGAGESPDEGIGADSGELPEEDATPDEATEEFQSKYQMAQSMGVGDKIKAALTGDKEWRSILIKDSNKLVSVSVIRNPRMTESEVLQIAKSTVQNDEIMRIICTNKEWVKNYLIRKALVENNKTPLPAALRFVATLSEKDLAVMGKSKNISSVIASQARRMLLTKKNGR
jgi:hypothetical protein